MIKQVIQLIRPGLFLPTFAVETPEKGDILVRPKYLSICAADQRYFRGNRPPAVLAKKLPLALFHEAVGEVLDDPSGELQARTFCVLLPGGVDSAENESNYRKGAFFRSSNADGFCQELMYLKRGEILPIQDAPAWIYVFSELMSVCCQALRQIEKVKNIPEGCSVGVWGDGAMAYMMALTVSQLKPTCRIIVFGKHDEKLLNFSFVYKRINITDNTEFKNEDVDFAIECVGGSGAQNAIAQAVDRLIPTGTLLLMGVSENAPIVPTRLVLEKGLTLVGTSRSTRNDFRQAMKLISKQDVKNSLLKIVSMRCSVSSASELIDVFNQDFYLPYKTIIDKII